MVPTLALGSPICSSWCTLSTGQRGPPTSLCHVSTALRSTPWLIRSSSRPRPTSRLMKLNRVGAKGGRRHNIAAREENPENFFTWLPNLVIHHHSEHGPP